MRPIAPAAFACLLLAAAVAGCSDGPKAPAEVLVESTPPEEVLSNGTLTWEPPKAKTRGHLAGVVVDEAIRPIEGAVVRLPGLDLERTTDRDGSFGFVDLHPGPYYVTVNATGYYPAEAMLEVDAERFTRAKVVLTAVPPPDPYHVTQSFEGYVELTGVADPFGLGSGWTCADCDFEAYVDSPGLTAVVIEAVLSGGTSSNGFAFQLRQGDTWEYGQEANPMRVLRLADDLDPDEERFDLYVEPTSFPAPEAGKRFQVFVTAFYNEEPPQGWSFVAGDA